MTLPDGFAYIARSARLAIGAYDNRRSLATGRELRDKDLSSAIRDDAIDQSTTKQMV
ncbi:hypothetical protein IKF15_02620 [Candidatus Saccharibacteria bacterium]|nr:hypothetical protein [Candidatus Saccharibacteria bacterium]